MGGLPPTGQRATCTGMYIFQFDEQGKIVEFWENLDLMGFLQQIGAFPAPAEASA
jgi:predicted ester cyclase